MVVVAGFTMPMVVVMVIMAVMMAVFAMMVVVGATKDECTHDVHDQANHGDDDGVSGSGWGRTGVRSS